MKSLELLGIVAFAFLGGVLTWGLGFGEFGEVTWLGGGLVFAAIFYGAMRLWSALNK